MILPQISQDIADESECSVLEVGCPRTILDGVTWYDIKARPGIDPAPMLRALCYLRLRGLLKFHDERTTLVRIPRAAELGQLATNFLCR